ncbi:MAG: DUF916 domain-containing protein [Patescibacteria group bacterium]
MKKINVCKIPVKIFFIALTLVYTSVPYASQAVEYGGFGGKPAYPREDNSRTESIFIHTLAPGAVQKDGVLVVNNSTTPKTVIIYGADSTPSTGGAFACKQFSEEKKDVGTWIQLAKSEITLQPGTNQIVPFTISVPENVGVGEHNGCILIQEKKAKVEGQAGASISIRTGLRVAIKVPGEIVRKLEVVGFTVDSDKGNFLLKPAVKNTGNVSIDANIIVETKNIFGSVIFSHDGQYPILRGETSDWNFELKKPFWGGLYHSSFVVEYDESVEADVGVKTDKTLVRVEGDPTWFFSFPTFSALVIEILILLALVSGVFFLKLSKKRKKWIKKTWVWYEISAGDDIQTLSKHFDVSWKLLAKVNKLQPPYALKQGNKIKVPAGK